MAYTQEGGWLNYFSPDAGDLVGVLDIGASSADAGEFVCIKPCVIKRVGFVVTDEVVAGTSTAPQVVFTKRPTPNSATGEVVTATLTVPDGTAVGETIILDLDTSDADARFDIGDSLELSHVVGTGSPTGQGIPFAVCMDAAEDASNMTGVTVSSQ